MPRSREPQSRSVAKAAPAARTTREQLIDLAAEVFASEGYASASVRDLGRRLGVTSGALYGNFRGKADLLAEAVDTRLTTDVWDLPDDVVDQSLAEMVAYQFAHYKAREQLMSLLLEGALAARGDAEVKERLHDTLGQRLSASTRAFRSRRDAEGFDPALNLDAVVKIIWSIEIGLRALSTLGFATPSQKDCADVVRHFMEGLQGSASAPRAVKAAKAVPRKRVAAQPAAPRKAARKRSA
jgi:AcrR family transcriptional regulator